MKRAHHVLGRAPQQVLPVEAQRALLPHASIPWRVRLYLGPFAVCHYGRKGRGLIFAQSSATVREHGLGADVTTLPFGGARAERVLFATFLTLKEYFTEITAHDFEMGLPRPELEAAVGFYKPEEEAVVLVKFRCGHLLLARMVLVPSGPACAALATEYVERPTLQLCLDDTG